MGRGWRGDQLCAMLRVREGELDVRGNTRFLCEERALAHYRKITMYQVGVLTHHNGEFLIVLHVNQARRILQLFHQVPLGEVVNQNCTRDTAKAGKKQAKALSPSRSLP